jgi:hypothetical protein
MNETMQKNKNMLCLIIAITNLIIVLKMLIEPVFRIVKNEESPSVAVIIGMEVIALVVTSITILLIVLAFMKKPERFNIYTVIACISYAGMALFSVFALVLKINGIYNSLGFPRKDFLEGYSWNSLAMGLIMTAFFFILTNAIVKKRRDENTYTKRFIYCEFILLGIYSVIYLATRTYANRTLADIIMLIAAFILTQAGNVCLVLVVRYIESKKELVDRPLPLQEISADETAE